MGEPPDFLAPVEGLGEGDAMEAWRWLVGDKAQPKLFTAMGDFVLAKPEGLLKRERVFLLDTNAGTMTRIAASMDELRDRMKQGNAPADWFKLDIVLGGSWEPENFRPVDWKMHVLTTGALHREIRKLPPGTRIAGVQIELTD